MTLTALKNQLKSFLDSNPESKIKKSGERYVVQNPWGDASLELQIPDTEDERAQLSTALNDLILPVELSAIYHVSRKALEVIWTAYRLPNEMDEVKKTRIQI